jgi:hypothetical protein
VRHCDLSHLRQRQSQRALDLRMRLRTGASIVSIAAQVIVILAAGLTDAFGAPLLEVNVQSASRMERRSTF